MCKHCADHPFDLCTIGAALLHGTTFPGTIPEEITYTTKVPHDRPDIFKRGMDLKYKDPETQKWYLMEITEVVVDPSQSTARITARFKEHLERDGEIPSGPPRP